MFNALLNLFFRAINTSKPSIQSTPTTTAQQVINASQLTNLTSTIFIDTETTGLNQDGKDEVLEIAIVDTDGLILLNTLVRPVRNTVWPQAQAIHGISPKDVSNSITWDALLPTIATISTGKQVVIYNATFDTSFFPVGFFPSVSCAMRRYSELNPYDNSWAKLSDAAIESGYSSSGEFHRALEDALACRYIWLFGIPHLEKTYPPIINQHITAEFTLGSGDHIPLIFDTIFTEQLKFLSIGSWCKFWTKDYRDDINIYRSGTINGSGKIATLLKTKNKELTQLLSEGRIVSMQLNKRNNDFFTFNIEILKTNT